MVAFTGHWGSGAILDMARAGWGGSVKCSEKRVDT